MKLSSMGANLLVIISALILLSTVFYISNKENRLIIQECGSDKLSRQQKEDCLVEKSREHDSKYICSLIPEMKNWCLINFAAYKNDPDICKLILPYELNQLPHESDGVHASCYSMMAMQFSDISICYRIDSIFEGSRNGCIKSVSVNLKNEALCKYAGPLEKECLDDIRISTQSN